MTDATKEFRDLFGREPTYAEAADLEAAIRAYAAPTGPATPHRFPPASDADRVRSIKADPPGRHRRSMYAFPLAMDALLSGERIRRDGWQPGDFVTVASVPDFEMAFLPRIEARAYAKPFENSVGRHIVRLGRQLLRRTAAHNAWAPWTPSNEDIFEKDWIVL